MAPRGVRAGRPRPPGPVRSRCALPSPFPPAPRPPSIWRRPSRPEPAGLGQAFADRKPSHSRASVCCPATVWAMQMLSSNFLSGTGDAMALLDSKVALITGAARGIGRAAAELFAREGARLVINDLDKEPLREAAEALRRAGAETAVLPGSVTDRDFPEKWIQCALDRFGRIDIIVNNAGLTWDAVIHKMTDEQWDRIIDLHLKAPFRIIRAAAPYLRETAKSEALRGPIPCRKIINVSSTSGVAGNAGQANYSAAKMGIVGLTKTVAKEWGPFNITCNAVAYGFID